MVLSGPAADLMRCGVVLIGAGLVFVCLGLARPALDAHEPSGMRRMIARALPRHPALARRLADRYAALAGAVGVLVGIGFLVAALGTSIPRT